MARQSWRTYFEFSPIDKNRVNGLCGLCKKNYKDQNGIFSNFLKHLRRAHPLGYYHIFSGDDDRSLEEKNFVDDDRATDDLTSKKSKQSRIILSIVKNLIIRCNLPLNIVENPGFREFMKESNFKFEPVSTKKLKHDIIPSLSHKVRKTIHETLNNTNHLTLTVDGWSDRRCRSFLGIICHFIDSKMMSQAYLIDFVRFKSPHTSENIQQLTEDVLERFNIKEKVFKIVTDNASSMVKAYKFGLCVDEESDTCGGESNSMPDTDPVFDDDHQDIEVNNFQVMQVHYDDAIAEDEGSSTIRLSCFIHTLQLCIRDGLKNVSYTSRVLGKCQTLAKNCHKSSKIADFLEGINKNIKKMNVTRWNSEFMLIKSILSIEKQDLESISELTDNQVIFSNNDFLILEEIVDVLEPFHEISIKCQAETVVTVSLVVPAIVHLTAHLRDIKQDLAFCGKLVQQLQSSLEKRFAGIINRLNLVIVDQNDPFNDPLYFMSAVLDPSFKFYWIRDLKLPVNVENRLKQNIIQLILDEISKDLTSSSSTKSSNQTNSSSKITSFLSSTPNPKRRKLFIYNNDNKSDDSNDLIELDPASELENYLNDSVRSRFSEYWLNSRMTLLKKLVTRIFTVQAFSAPIERVFSHANLILSSRRTNMNETLFRELVFLKANQGLL